MSGAELKKLREESGLTVKEVLDGYTGKMNKSLYSNIENGLVEPTQELEFWVLSRVLSTDDKHELKQQKTENTQVITTLLAALSNGEYITRDKLRVIAGIKSDRTMREIIERLRRYYPILNFQDGKGYIMTDDPELCKQFVQQEEARAKSIFYRLRPVKAIARGAQQ